VTELLYLDQAMDGIPDNISQLVNPIDIRNAITSSKDGMGFLTTVTEVNIPVSSGSFTAINPLLQDVTVSGELWTFDANNFAVTNYSAIPATVPPGYTKVLQIIALMLLHKVGGGTDEYEFQFTKNGSAIGLPEPYVFKSTPDLVTLVVDVLAEVANVTDLYGVAVAGSGTSDDFDLLGCWMQLRDNWLLTDPNVGAP
jgi:hypothetical protein